MSTFYLIPYQNYPTLYSILIFSVYLISTGGLKDGEELRREKEGTLETEEEVKRAWMVDKLSIIRMLNESWEWGSGESDNR